MRVNEDVIRAVSILVVMRMPNLRALVEQDSLGRMLEVRVVDRSMLCREKTSTKGMHSCPMFFSDIHVLLHGTIIPWPPSVISGAQLRESQWASQRRPVVAIIAVSSMA